MGRKMKILAIVGITTALALISQGTEATGTGLLAILFLVFGASIIVCQSIPGLMLFSFMMKGLFSRAVKKPLPVAEKTKKISD